jgi:hypothetical protein
MFLRSKKRRKDGKKHRYWALRERSPKFRQSRHHRKGFRRLSFPAQRPDIVFTERPQARLRINLSGR